LELQFAEEEISTTTNEAEATPNERMSAMEKSTNNEANCNPVEEKANNNTVNEANVHGRMPGQLPTVANAIENDYDNSRDYAPVK
jgi:hypothetical protein